MIVTQRHIEKFLDLTKKELIHITRAIQGIQLMLNDLYNPKGYNIGMNQGRNAGGSIEHLHFHLMDSPDLLTAKGIPCAFKKYEVLTDCGWKVVENGIPKSNQRIRQK